MNLLRYTSQLCFALLLLIICSGAKPADNPDFTFKHKFAYTVDGAGIFVYDLQTHKERKIFNTPLPIVGNSLRTLNDSEISISTRTTLHQFDISKLLGTDNNSNYRIENGKKYEISIIGPGGENILDTLLISHYIDTTYTINIHSGSHYISRATETIHRSKSQTIITSRFDRLSQTTDTIVQSRATKSDAEKSLKYTLVNTIDDKKAYLYDRTIYFIDKQDTIKLYKAKEYDYIIFDGLNLSMDAQKIIYSYREMNVKIKYRLYEYDIKSKESRLIAKDYYENLLYSPDHQLVLMRNFHKQHTDRKPIYSIYVIDPSTKQIRNLCTGNDYIWLE